MQGITHSSCKQTSMSVRISTTKCVHRLARVSLFNTLAIPSACTWSHSWFHDKGPKLRPSKKTGDRRSPRAARNTAKIPPNFEPADLKYREFEGLTKDAANCSKFVFTMPGRFYQASCAATLLLLCCCCCQPPTTVAECCRPPPPPPPPPLSPPAPPRLRDYDCCCRCTCRRRRQLLLLLLVLLLLLLLPLQPHRCFSYSGCTACGHLALGYVSGLMPW